MGRDYAQRGGGRSQARSKSRPSGGGGVPGWIWLVFGLAIGLAIAAIVWLKRPATPLPGLGEAAEAAPAARRQGGREAPITLPPKEKERFSFYEILKNQEVLIPREELKAGTPPPEVDTGTGSYILQVASYRSQADADQQKARLALLGLESRIESVTIDDKDRFYRVRVGPIGDWAQVQTTLARLEENGMQALVIKLR